MTTKGKIQVSKLLEFVRGESGATAIEYGLIATLIAVVLVGGLTLFGENMNKMFEDISSSVTGVVK